ncbi:MAG: glycosyltransferase [Nitrospirae bacterium]|nr:glycosyltransferase [Nitrospirota bacterium]
MGFAMPFVSVIIPAYNCERFIAEAVESVRRQDHRPIEIIVVDDGSTDGTSAHVKNLGKDIRYVHQSNRGPAAARNRGIEMAKGEVFTFLDADDYWPENKLEIQLAHLRKYPRIEVVLGRIQFTGSLTEADMKIRFEGPDNTMVNINLGSGIFKRAVFEKVGIFDESLRHFEDHDWFLRAREKDVSMVILENITLYYRRHENSMSSRKSEDDPTMIQILKKSLDRRRQDNKGLAELLPRFFDFDDRKGTQKHREGDSE